MKSDIQIARETNLAEIEQIAQSVEINPKELERYGKYIAKVPLKLIDNQRAEKSNLVAANAVGTQAIVLNCLNNSWLSIGLKRIVCMVAILFGKVCVGLKCLVQKLHIIVVEWSMNGLELLNGFRCNHIEKYY